MLFEKAVGWLGQIKPLGSIVVGFAVGGSPEFWCSSLTGTPKPMKLKTTSKQASSVDARLLLMVLVFCILASNLTLFYLGRNGLPYRDFKIFYVGALLVRSNHAAELYDFGLQRRLQTELLHIRLEEWLPYNHTPFELLLFLPFARLSYVYAFYLWLAVSASLGIVCGAALARNLPRLSHMWALFPYALIVCLFPFFLCVLEGQDSALALILAVACWLSFRNASDGNLGFLLGIGLFKFQIFLPLAFILAFRRPKLLQGYALSAALVTIASAIVVGPTGFASYPRALLQMARASESGISFQFGMDPRLLPNLRGLLYGLASGGRAQIPSSVAAVVLAVLLLASMWLTVWTLGQTAQHRLGKYNTNETTDLAFALAMIVSVLLSFHVLAHDLTVLAVPFAIIVDRFLASNGRREPRRFVLGALIFLFYPIAVYLALFAWSLVFVLGGVVALLAFLVSRELREATEEVGLTIAAQVN
jgi:hypothetical protein